MQLKTLLVYGLLMISGLIVSAGAQQKFDKANFYAVMKSGGKDAIEKEIETLEDAPAGERKGYEGALLIRKAEVIKGAKERLKIFKEGRVKLETAIAADNDNAEFRFLRLVIEEHAPKIVKYHADIEKDKAIIIKNFKNLPPAAQHAVLDYCSNSKVLHKEDF